VVIIYKNIQKKPVLTLYTLQNPAAHQGIPAILEQDRCLANFYPFVKQYTVVLSMNMRYILPAAILIFAIVATPVSAFTAKKLVMTVQENGDADINFNYQLTWPEKFAYSLIPGKEEIIQSALNSKFPSTTVDAIRVTKTSTDFTVREFATISTTETPAATTYRTPAVSFNDAGNLLNAYPLIARILSPDFSPDITTVQFPHGQKYTYDDATEIPEITHKVTT
jgi:hypothetical protein